MLDTFDALQDYEDLNAPEKKERYPGVYSNIQDRGAAEELSPTWRHHTEQGIDCGPANPCLNSKPAASDDCAQHRWNICALRSKRGAGENGEGDSVFCSSVCVENHGYEYDRVAQHDRDHRLPPVHACLNKATRESVGGNHHAHANPEGSDIPGRPGALFDCCRREVFVP